MLSTYKWPANCLQTSQAHPHYISEGTPSSFNHVFRHQAAEIYGQYHSAKGTTEETVGNVTGAESCQRGGAEEHAQGEGEYNAAQAHGYVEGTKDRVGGRKDAVNGDREQEAGGNVRRDQGEMQQDVNRPS